MTRPSTPAGWYPDPDGSGGLRYWDGNTWTEHRSPATPSPAPADKATAAEELPASEQATSVVSLPDQPTTVVRTGATESEQPTAVVRTEAAEPETEQPSEAEQPGSSTESPAAAQDPAPDPFEQPFFESFETPSFEEISSGASRSSSPPPAADAEPSEPSEPSADPPTYVPPTYAPQTYAQPKYGPPTSEGAPYGGQTYGQNYGGPNYGGPPPGFTAPPSFDGGSGGGPNNRKLIIGLLSAFGALILVLILVLVYFFVIRDKGTVERATPATSTSESTSSPASATESETTSETTFEEPPPGGGEATEGDYTFSVTGTEERDTVTSPISEFVETVAEGKFFVVYLDVGNTGTEPLDFISVLQVLNADGDTFEANPEASFYVGGGVVTIDPGAVVQTAVVFDVPVDTVPESIEVHGIPGGSGVEIPL